MILWIIIVYILLSCMSDEYLEAEKFRLAQAQIAARADERKAKRAELEQKRREQVEAKRVRTSH